MQGGQKINLPLMLSGRVSILVVYIVLAISFVTDALATELCGRGTIQVKSVFFSVEVHFFDSLESRLFQGWIS